MDAHFRAFSFVERIASFQQGSHIRGQYTIPRQLDGFPLSLVGEAIGQLAAWGSMSLVDFEYRPLAGLAGQIKLLSSPRPGERVELEANLEKVDEESVEYTGRAFADGRPVVELLDCVGPMVPVVDFDDPVALRRRFDQLRREDSTLPGVAELPSFTLERTGGELGQSASATFQVPTSAPMFEDHFPRRPVFPGSLLMHLNLQLGAPLLSELPAPPNGRWIVESMVDMKLRSLIPPGTSLQLSARVKHRPEAPPRLAFETRVNQELIATAGLMLAMKEVQ
jgi:3-hydroxymyristoyl/3-hydroxydecanoyl-(acyl carrier protein) dehydratase